MALAAIGSLPCSFGRYRLLERVGGGGMAVVFRGTLLAEGGFEKEVAVKVVREELAADEQFIEMFLDEARLAARLSHANVVQTFDFGQVEGTYFLAMEYVRGRTLAGLLRVCRARQMPLGPARSLHIAAQVARGLGHAHRLCQADGTPLGLVHRDVSPQNVLVSREGEVKLVDFGIAKAALRSHVTQPGKIRGKCAYMSPEQARGQVLDARSDLFSLGIVLWESITGATLFEGGSELAVLEQVITKDIPAPSRMLPGLPPDVDRAVMRLLCRDPAGRPASGDVAARELSEVALGLSRSQGDIDLADFQRSLGSGTQLQDAVAPAAAAPSPSVADASREASSTEAEATVRTSTARVRLLGRGRVLAALGAAGLAVLVAALRLGFAAPPAVLAPPAVPAEAPAAAPAPPAGAGQGAQASREPAPVVQKLQGGPGPRPLDPRPHVAAARAAPAPAAPAALILSARAESKVSLDGGPALRLSRLPSQVATVAGRHTLRFDGPNGRCSVRLTVAAGDHLSLLLEADGAVFRLNGDHKTALGCR